MHIEDPGAHRTQKLPAHKAEDIVLLVEAGGIEEHHLHEAGVGIRKLRIQVQRFGEARDGIHGPLEEAMPDLLLLGRVGLVEESLAEVHAAEHVVIRHGNCVELHIRLGVLNVGLHQRRALLDVLDQHLLLGDGLLHQRSLLGGKRAGGLELRLLLRVRAAHTEAQDQKGEGELPKHHVQLLVQYFVNYFLAFASPLKRPASRQC